MFTHGSTHGRRIDRYTISSPCEPSAKKVSRSTSGLPNKEFLIAKMANTECKLDVFDCHIDFGNQKRFWQSKIKIC